jgi:hypothetical protein
VLNRPGSRISGASPAPGTVDTHVAGRTRGDGAEKLATPCDWESVARRGFAMSKTLSPIRTAGDSPDSRARAVPKERAEASKKTAGGSTFPEAIVPPRPNGSQTIAAGAPRTGNATGKRRPRRAPGSRAALIMLTKCPVFATPVPRHHINKRGSDGSRLVMDRATSERFVVYLPQRVPEFRAGHRAGLWYLRLINELTTTPSSAGFPSVRAAVDALRAGDWKAIRPCRDSTRRPIRVIWS